MVESLTPHPTVVQWYAVTPLRVLTTSESLGWSTVSVSIERSEPMLEDIAVPFLEEDMFGVLLDGTARARFRRNFGASVNVDVGPQSLQLIPRHTDQVGGWDSAWTYACVRLNRQFVTETAATIQHGDPTRIEFLPTFFFKDPFLYYLGLELVKETRSANPYGRLYAESLANTLTLYLLRHYSTGQMVRELSTSRFTPAQLGLVDDYIYTHLDQKISLADLAACLHLSVPHFERMFRATTHLPPYQYVLELRIERAKLLLRNPRLSLAEVANQCGFSSQSHFTRHFTRYVGVSPARFARGARE